MAAVDMQQLGREFKAARARRGYSQETVARLLGVARVPISQIERGQIARRQFGIVASYAALVGLDLTDCLPRSEPEAA